MKMLELGPAHVTYQLSNLNEQIILWVTFWDLD